MYETIENVVSKSNDYASTLEIEFIKNSTEGFFKCIPIGKWNDFVDILKNIKKRRGSKGIMFKMTITEYSEDTKEQLTTQNEKVVEQSQVQDNQVEIELLFCRRIIFLLSAKKDSDFTKGLERIEITIENLTDIFNRIAKPFPQDAKIGSARSNMNFEPNQLNILNQVQLFIFLFDVEKRVWKNL
jgi:hypothetical protein